MSFVEHEKREANFKIVYYGPPLAGKRSNMEWIYQHLATPGHGLEDVIVVHEDEPARAFGFCPPDIAPLEGLRVRVFLYTVPMSSMNDPLRSVILRGVDGVVFVCDSQPERMETNRLCREQLEDELAAQQRSLAELAHVMQYNKRDLENAVSVASMRTELNVHGAPDSEAVATRGENVAESLHGLIPLMLRMRPPR